MFGSLTTEKDKKCLLKLLKFINLLDIFVAKIKLKVKPTSTENMLKFSDYKISLKSVKLIN